MQYLCRAAVRSDSSGRWGERDDLIATRIAPHERLILLSPPDITSRTQVLVTSPVL
jgi:hypothetical protein